MFFFVELCEKAQRSGHHQPGAGSAGNNGAEELLERPGHAGFVRTAGLRLQILRRAVYN